jgi:hypothetical protein
VIWWKVVLFVLLAGLLLFILIRPRAGYSYERLPCGDLVPITIADAPQMEWDMPIPGEDVTHTLLTWVEFVYGVRYPDIAVPLPPDGFAYIGYAGSPPRTGMFVIELRFVNSAGLQSEPTITSMGEPARVPDPWCYQVKPVPPGGGVIE